MKKRILALLMALMLSTVAGMPASTYAESAADLTISNGHFYTQGTGNSGGNLGFRITDDGGIDFWTEFRKLGGPEVLGFPISQRFVLNGFVHQATQKAILQWRPESNRVAFLNVFDLLHDEGEDGSLLVEEATPLTLVASSAEAARPFSQVVADRLSLLTANPAIQSRYYAVSSVIDPLLIYGLPTSTVQDMGNHYAIRLQRAVIQQWKVSTPWAPAGETTVANGGEIGREYGLIPHAALTPVARTALDTIDVPAPSDGLAELADSLKPAVVRVVVPGNGFGSGIIFDASGLIVTNRHVVEDAVNVIVELLDGRKVAGKVLGTDPLIDIAVVKIDASGLKQLALGDSETVQVGEDVLAIGYTPSVANPPSARIGEVLAMIRQNRPVAGSRFSGIESTVFLHPGDSGGPLLNENGEVIGVNTSITFVPGDETVVISQSLAINVVKLAIQEIMAARNGGPAAGAAVANWLPLATDSGFPVYIDGD